MPCCAPDHHCSHACSNREKCKLLAKKPPKHKAPHKIHHTSEQPNLSEGDWELQYCKWSGWTWIKKDSFEIVSHDGIPTHDPHHSPQTAKETQRHVRNHKHLHQKSSGPVRAQTGQHQKKKKGRHGCFECFRKTTKYPPFEEYSPEALQPSMDLHESVSHQKLEQSSSSNSSSEAEEQGHCCCCCPCMQQNCCCCCNQETEEKLCKTMETQTHKEVKEQETKMSEVQIHKKKSKKRRCCCSKAKNTCCRNRICQRCPCKITCQRKCVCQCKSKIIQKLDTDPPKDPSTSVNSHVINYCLKGNLTKPGNLELMDVKTTNISALHKSLDILLRNNMNIMNILDKKQLRPEIKPLASQHTIASLTLDNLRKPDPEHSNLLTAVCDAILSSHKFDTNRVEIKESEVSLNPFLEKIFSDLNFPTMLNSEEAKPVPEAKIHKTLQLKKSFSKLVKNKSRILTAPRFPKRVEALRKHFDMLKINNQDGKLLGSRKRSDGYKVNNKNPKHNIDLSKLGITRDNTPHHSSANVSMQSHPLENIEHLLNTIEYVNTSSTMEPSFVKNGTESTNSDSLLKLPTPSLTQYEFLTSQNRKSNKQTDIP